MKIHPLFERWLRVKTDSLAGLTVSGCETVKEWEAAGKPVVEEEQRKSYLPAMGSDGTAWRGSDGLWHVFLASQHGAPDVFEGPTPSETAKNAEINRLKHVVDVQACENKAAQAEIERLKNDLSGWKERAGALEETVYREGKQIKDLEAKLAEGDAAAESVGRMMAKSASAVVDTVVAEKKNEIRNAALEEVALEAEEWGNSDAAHAPSWLKDTDKVGTDRLIAVTRTNFHRFAAYVRALKKP